MSYSLSDDKNCHMKAADSNVLVDDSMYVSSKLVAFHFINNFISIFGKDINGSFLSSSAEKDELIGEIKSSHKISHIMMLSSIGVSWVLNFLVSWALYGDFTKDMFRNFALTSLLSFAFLYVFYKFFSRSSERVKYDEVLLTLGKKKIDFLRKSGVDLIAGVNTKNIEDYIFWIGSLLNGVNEHNDRLKSEISRKDKTGRVLPFSDYIFGNVRGRDSRVAYLNLRGICSLLEQELEKYMNLEKTLKPSSEKFQKVRNNLLNYLSVSADYLKDFMSVEKGGNGAYRAIYNSVLIEITKKEDDDKKASNEIEFKERERAELIEIRRQRELVLRSNERLLDLISLSDKVIK